MSGPICPDCGMFDIDLFVDDDGVKKNICEFCGWKGDLLPRKILAPKQQRSYRDEHRRIRDLRDRGELFFVRIYVSDPGIIEDDLDICENIMDILDIDTLDGPFNDPPYYFNMVRERPSEKDIQRIGKFRGIKEILVL